MYYIFCVTPYWSHTICYILFYLLNVHNKSKGNNDQRTLFITLKCRANRQWWQQCRSCSAGSSAYEPLDNNSISTLFHKYFIHSFLPWSNNIICYFLLFYFTWEWQKRTPITGTVNGIACALITFNEHTCTTWTQ